MCIDLTSYLLGKKSSGGGITPTGNINITNTSSVNVTNYATAQVVDEDLVASNIKKDVNILGVTGTYEGSGGLDWSAIGYSSAPKSVTDGYNYAKEIYDNWQNVSSLSSKFLSDISLIYMPLVDTSNATSMSNMFMYCTNLTDVPLLDTSICASFAGMFSNCTNLKNIPIFNTTSATNTASLSSVFTNCTNLSTQSLDNILQMCIGATSYTGTKTLAKLGFVSTNYPATTIQALPHYQDFIDAGWTIGY